MFKRTRYQFGCVERKPGGKGLTFGRCVTASNLQAGPRSIKARSWGLSSSTGPSRTQEGLLKHCCSESTQRTQTLVW